MKQSITIKFNAWIICVVLLIANLVTLGFWQPWNDNSVSDRTIAITGSTTIESEPDQYVFNPYYQKEGADKAAINTELSDLAETITAKLKELGVDDSAIKTDVNSYDYAIYYGGEDDQSTSTLYMTITLQDKTLAQAVQDYLVTTLPDGSITPQISFSTAKQKTLETQARDEALADARSKAEASAKQLGANLGKVISVSDINSGGIMPMPWLSSRDMVSSSSEGSSGVADSSYSIQPGLNEYSFSVQVSYELK